MCRKYWLNACSRNTVVPAMTISVDLGGKVTKQEEPSGSVVECSILEIEGLSGGTANVSLSKIRKWSEMIEKLLTGT